ncbi:50S ribosomal protein L32, partial [Klebsiella pneumoniae]|nr:50S ribosomal protein L32 [Klebsiella pneumoniae]
WQLQKNVLQCQKMCIRKNLWKKTTYFSIVQSYSLAKSRSFSGVSEHPKPKGFSRQQTDNNGVIY